MKDMEQINAFFKPQNLNKSKDDLKFPGLKGKIPYERMYADYYSALFQTFKSNIPLDLPENQFIRESKWEPLLKAGHDSFAIALVNYLPYMNTQSEMGKLMGCFDILKLHGMGIFELGLAPKGAFMKISVNLGIEDLSFESMEEEPELPVSAFTAGIVLACFNLSMSTSEVPEVDINSLEEMYQKSPDIIQVKYGYLSQEESEFTLHAK